MDRRKRHSINRLTLLLRKRRNVDSDDGYRIVERLFIAVILLFFATAGAAVGVVAAYMRQLPNVDVLQGYDPALTPSITRVYDTRRELIGEFYAERRMIVPLSQVPRRLVEAFIAAEDEGFYRHRGVSIRGIVRSIFVNLKEGRRAQGASTITQQLARQFFLTPEKLWSRKIKEALLAVEIERNYSKDEILDMYLNKIYFGSGAYGVQSASHIYFGKDVSELTLSEAALLAGIPRSPGAYSPYLYPEGARKRRNVVLNLMRDGGFITASQAEEAKGEPLVLRRGQSGGTESVGINRAPYFMEHIRQYLENKYGTDAIYKWGMSVYTTLDLEMQKGADEALRGGLERVDKMLGYRPVAGGEGKTNALPSPRSPEDWMATLKKGDLLQGRVVEVSEDGARVDLGGIVGELSAEGVKWAAGSPGAIVKAGDTIIVRVLNIDAQSREITLGLDQKPRVQGAIVALDPQTGYIKAMVGGYDFYDDEGSGKFNRAVQAYRQPGSSFKTFAYAAAMDGDFTPSAIIVDAPIIYYDEIEGIDRPEGRRGEDGPKGEEREGWQPKNYYAEYQGPVTLRYALENSINVVAIKLLDRVGIDKAISYAHKMGIKSPLRRDLTLAIGTSEVTPLEMASAYGVLANRGVRVEPMAIIRVEDFNGRVIEENISKEEVAIGQDTAFLVTNMLKGVMVEGTGQRASREMKRSLVDRLAGKTGTTDEYIDAWFVGFSPDLVAAVYVGFDDRTPLKPPFSSKGLTGADAALPIWISFMSQALNSMPLRDFSVPENIVFREVDYKTGLLANPQYPDRKTIVEAFKEGTEPKKYYVPEIDPGRAPYIGLGDLRTNRSGTDSGIKKVDLSTIIKR
jgi:penicillin-binding protein 1A